MSDIEMDVWVSYDEASNLRSDCYVVTNEPQEEDWKYNRKAKLIIKVPELKIEITPERLREAMLVNFNKAINGQQQGYFNDVEKELFKECYE